MSNLRYPLRKLDSVEDYLQIDVLDYEPSDIQESHKIDEQINNDDDNLSNIDLARALIESGEREKAKEIILNIIKTGSADQAHEARILNLQIS